MTAGGLNGFIRVCFAAVLGFVGLALFVIGALHGDHILMIVAGGMVTGSGLTAWDARIV